MAEDGTEISTDEALSSPLIDTDPVSGRTRLLAGNLKQRFGREVIDCYKYYSKRRNERGLLEIEKMELESVTAFQKYVKRAIDKFTSEDPISNPLSKEEHGNLAQYLSWSYYNATEHPIEDKEFIPTTQALKDVKSLYIGVKSAYLKK